MISQDELEHDRRLWHAVILQAILDATSANADDLATVQARRWLTSPNRQFNEVCALAGFEPDRVRNRAIAAIEKASIAPPKQRIFMHVPVTCHGRTMTLTQWAAEIGIKPSGLAHRLRSGWSLERATSTPAPRSRQAPSIAPGVVTNFDEASRDRRGSVAQDSA